MRAITDRSPPPGRVLGPEPVTADDIPVPGTAGGPPEAVTYVVITPAGELLTRTADGHVVIDEWDTPYQPALWATVHAEVDPHRGEVNGVGLADGLRAKVADAAMGDPISDRFGLGPPALYPPNPVASAMLTTLGHPARLWWGTIVIVADENDADGITASLTSEQLDVLVRAHREATAR